jgi:hypothetical protein
MTLWPFRDRTSLAHRSPFAATTRRPHRHRHFRKMTAPNGGLVLPTHKGGSAAVNETDQVGTLLTAIARLLLAAWSAEIPADPHHL